MTWELRKIGSSGRLCLLLVLAVLCSGVLFALHATGDSGGYTVSGLRQAMAQKDLPGYEERLWQELEQAAYTGTRSEYDALRRELSAADAALARVRQAEEYPSFRAGLAAESRLKLRMGLFEGFAARSLECGAAVYESLADVIPRAAFLGGPEVLLSFHLTDALALLFPLAAGLTLLTHERAAGLVNLTRPTRLGRSRVYGRKLAAAATLSTAGFVLLYGINTLIAGLLYGFAGLDAPVQSLYGFAACPYRMTVGGLLALAAGLKYLWLLCCTALIFLLCARAANAAAAVGCAAVCGGIAALMAGSTQLWLRNLSLWQLADGQALCREAVYLNLLGSPSDRVLLGAIFLAALAVIAGIGGAALYAQTPGGSGKWVAFTRSLPRPRHTCLAGHELYKALISRCGLWILLAFFAVIALLYGRFTPERSEFEVYYRNYSEFLSGAPSREKDDYLASEQARFDELNEQLVELGQRYPDSVTFDREAEPIRNQLHAEDAFHMAQNQYRALRPGQVYLYQTGYQRLLGADALRQDVLELGGAFLAVALLLFGSFAGGAGERRGRSADGQPPPKERGAVEMRHRGGLCPVADVSPVAAGTFDGAGSLRPAEHGRSGQQCAVPVHPVGRLDGGRRGASSAGVPASPAGGICRRGTAALPPLRHGSGPAAVAAASPAARGGGIRLDVKDTKRVRTSPSAPFLAYNM